MTFARRKRALLGGIALLAPVPLPLNEVLEWGVLVIYLALVGLFLYRAGRDRSAWFGDRALNLLGLVYIPVLVYDLAVLARGQLIRAVLHLCLFAVLAKLYSVRRERDKWQILVVVCFVFFAAMATSVHPSILLYLVLYLAFLLTLLSRFAFFHVLSRFGRRRVAPGELPSLGLHAGATAGALLLAIPIFVALPRLREPYLRPPGTGTGSIIHASGFSDEVTLDGIGSIRENRDVVLRLDYAGPVPVEPRFKGATFEQYMGSFWRRSGRLDLVRRDGLSFRIAPGPVAFEVRAYLKPLRSKSLPLPLEAKTVELPVTMLEVDNGGAVRLAYEPRRMIELSIGIGDSTPAARPVPGTEPGEPTLDLSGVSERMSELAAGVMGQGTVRERVERLERYLATELEYSTEFLGRSGEDPLESFLFRDRRGHCEYFASAMVLLARSQGVPARLVTGFLGAEHTAIEGYYVVRQRNAHAWVEAYIPEEGWVTFDPTPATGRPGAFREGWAGYLEQVWDYVIFRWDRYVLTYGFEDQREAMARVKALAQALLRRLLALRHSDAGGESVAEASAVASQAAEGPRLLVGGGGWHVAGSVAVVLGLVAILVLRRRKRDSALQAFARLRRTAERRGLPIRPSSAPLEVQSVLEGHLPGSSETVARVVGLYLRESFGGDQLGSEERRTVQEEVTRLRRDLRRLRKAS